MWVRWLKRFLLFFFLVFPWVWLDINSVEGWHTYPDLWEPRYYLVNVLLLWWLAAEGVVFAFWLRRRPFLSRCCVLLACLPLFLGFSDLFVMLGCFQTSGPGGIYCLSHRNWHRRFVTTNSLGYWEDEPRLESGPRWVALGDSFTWGQGVWGKDLRFTEQLSQLLGHRVWNFGVNGTTTRDQVQLILPHLAPLKPEVVFVCYLANDIHDEVALFEATDNRWGFWSHRFMVGSPTMNFVYWRFLNLVQLQEFTSRYFASLFLNYLNPQVMERHQQDIQTMCREIRQMGARPVAVLLPFPHLFRGIQPAHREAIYAAVEEAFKQGGAEVIALQNLEERFPPGRFEVSPMDAHPNAEVHAAIARGIADWLKAHPEVLAPSSP